MGLSYKGNVELYGPGNWHHWVKTVSEQRIWDMHPRRGWVKPSDAREEPINELSQKKGGGKSSAMSIP